MAVRLNQGVGETYRRLGENGKPEKVARIAEARKLLLIAHMRCTARVGLIGRLRAQGVDIQYSI